MMGAGGMKEVYKKIDDRDKFAFISSFIIMLITHGFCFLNIMYSHDTLRFYKGSIEEKIGLGRWLYPLIVKIRPLASPWLVGIFSILYISLSVVIVSRILEFTKAQVLCLSILFATSIALTSLFCSYIYDGDADCLAILLACLAVYVFSKLPKGTNIVIAALLLVLSLAIYQIFITVALGLFIMLIIYRMKEVKAWSDIFKGLLFGVEELAVVILATAIYLPLMHFFAKKYGVDLSSEYNGPGKLGGLSGTAILKAIPTAYIKFKKFFFTVNAYNSVLVDRMNWLMLAILLLAIVFYALANRRNLLSLVLIIPCIIIMPLALNAVFLTSDGLFVQFMIYSFGLSYLLPFVFINITSNINMGNELIDRLIKHIQIALAALAVLAIFVIGINNVIYSNGAYVYKKLVYDNTSEHMYMIWKDINNVEGYIDGETKVLFIGEFADSNLAYHGPMSDQYNKVLRGASGSTITYQGTLEAYFRGIMGTDTIVERKDNMPEPTEDFLSMPVYPQDGYCRMIDGMVIVKLN
jgi:hypothetical protein